jgi:hypothetical protein
MTKGEGARLTALFALTLGALWIIQGMISVRGTGDDWKIFWNASHHVGTPQLLTVARFAYTPGVAWGLWFLSWLSRPASYFLYTALMLCCGFLSAFIASKLYRLPVMITCLMLVWWWPLTISVCLGQNSPLALLLAVMMVYSFVKCDQPSLGVAVGLSFYKPTIGIPFLIFLIAFRQWKAIAIVGISLVLWYLLSAGAVHDLFWPKPYLHMLSDLYNYDRVVDGDYAIGIPGILIHAGLLPIAGWIIGIVLLIGMTVSLRKVSRLEAGSMMPAIALATAGHAYGYDALLLLPALWLLVTRKTPITIPLIVASYIVAPAYLASRPLRCIGITRNWNYGRMAVLETTWGPGRAGRRVGDVSNLNRR